MPEQNFDIYSLVTICVLGAMSPGPSLFVILNIAAQYGVKIAICAAWSHALGIGLWASLSLLIWTTALNHYPLLSQGLSLIASLYLIYMSYGLLHSIHGESQELISANFSKDPHQSLATEGESNAYISACVTGLSIALANPKILLFFTVLYPQLTPQTLDGGTAFLAVSIPVLVDGCWYQLITIFSAKLGLLTFIQRFNRLTTIVMALVLILITLRTLSSLFIA